MHVTVTTQDAKASVTVTTRDEGGSGASMSTPTSGSGNEVQDITGPTGTAFTVTLGPDTTSSLTYGTSTAANVASALGLLGGVGGAANLLVIAATSGANTIYRAMFTAAKAGMNIAAMSASVGTVTTVKDGGGTPTNETQTVTVKASAGKVFSRQSATTPPSDPAARAVAAMMRNACATCSPDTPPSNNSSPRTGVMPARRKKI